MKKSVIAAVAASNMTIFSGLVNAQDESPSPPDDNEIVRRCGHKRVKDYHSDTNGKTYDSCYFTGEHCSDKVECGWGVNGQPVEVHCDIHRSAAGGQICTPFEM